MHPYKQLTSTNRSTSYFPPAAFPATSISLLCRLFSWDSVKKQPFSSGFSDLRNNCTTDSRFCQIKIYHKMLHLIKLHNYYLCSLSKIRMSHLCLSPFHFSNHIDSPGINVSCLCKSIHFNSSMGFIHFFDPV